jgi:hypothetical protein
MIEDFSVLTITLYFVGSILVNFQVSGSSIMLNSTVNSLCGAVENGTNFNFRGSSLRLANYMSVGGENYYGSKCAKQVMKQTNVCKC